MTQRNASEAGEDRCEIAARRKCFIFGILIREQLTVLNFAEVTGWENLRCPHRIIAPFSKHGIEYSSSAFEANPSHLAA
ncbi:hypothetical protein KFK09_001198 [Dendrobium nobile]|uniref:Uncharacterized protein n=1 Tax=Dendrobium nobile TaxID=94219 RepID=A0A8T3C456_DENNO|nr:hypothetical protein KFK09_001198 [Dendrobium nobile]